MWHLDFTLVFGGIFPSTRIKYIGHTDGLLIIICELYYTLTLGIVEDTIVYSIYRKVKLFIFLGGIHRPPCILYYIPYNLEYPTIIRQFPVVNDIEKCPHLGSTLINIVEDVYDVKVFHQFITKIHVLHHGFNFLLHILL